MSNINGGYLQGFEKELGTTLTVQKKETKEPVDSSSHPSIVDGKTVIGMILENLTITYLAWPAVCLCA